MTRIHLSLATCDLAASTAFYATLFGEAPDKVADDYVRFSPSEHPIVLSLTPGTPAAPTGHEHWGLRFADVASTTAAWRRGVAAGLPLQKVGEVSCCFAVQQKAWATDPDGRPWELYTVVDDLQAPAAPSCPS